MRAPVTRGYFFLLGALRLVNAASPRNIDQKKISSGTQGTCSQSFKKICAWELLGANVLKWQQILGQDYNNLLKQQVDWKASLCFKMHLMNLKFQSGLYVNKTYLGQTGFIPFLSVAPSSSRFVFLACDWFKNVLFSTNSLAKLLSDSYWIVCHWTICYRTV